MTGDLTHADTYHAHDQELLAAGHYRELFHQVGEHFFPGAPRPRAVRAPAGHGYTYTEGEVDAQGIWHAVPVLHGSPKWWKNMAARKGTDARWNATDAAFHEWGFELGGAQTENQAVGLENRMLRYWNKLRGAAKPRPRRG